MCSAAMKTVAIEKPADYVPSPFILQRAAQFSSLSKLRTRVNGILCTSRLTKSCLRLIMTVKRESRPGSIDGSYFEPPAVRAHRNQQEGEHL